MRMNKTFKDFWYRMRIFLWFLITEPARQAKEIFKGFIRVLEMFNKTLTWAYIAILGLIASLFIGSKYTAAIALIFFLFVVLLWEWERGFFVYRYRQVTKKRLEKKAKNMSGDFHNEYKEGDDWTDDSDYSYRDRHEYVKEVKEMEEQEEKKNG